MKKLIASLLIISFNAYSYPVGVKGQSQTAASYPSMIKVGNSNATVTSTGTLLEGLDNYLVNPNMEGSNSSGTATSWVSSGSTGSASTYTISTSASEVIEGAQSQKIVFDANGTGDLDYRQSVTVTAGMPKQWVVGITYSASSTVAAFQICSLVDGATTLGTCVPTASLILDGAAHTIEIPTVITGTTSIGILVKSTNSTGTVILDKAYIKQGLGTQALQLDNVYSAKISIAGVVSGENKDFITGDCTVSGTSVYTCPVTAFTVLPNCTGTMTTQSRAYVEYKIASSTATSLVFTVHDSSTDGVAANPFSIICQASGNDYLKASSSVYSQASANTNPVAYTPIFTGLGTVGASSVTWAREGKYLVVNGNVTTGAVAGSNISISLPVGLTVDSSFPVSASGYGIVGQWARNTTSTLAMTIIAAPSGSTVFASIYGGGTRGAITPAFGTDVGSSEGQTFYFRIPISGWSNSAQIVGSFEKIEKCANTLECTDVFSAQISAAGVVSNENVDWINNNCTTGGTSGQDFTCTYNTNLKDGTNPLVSLLNCSTKNADGTSNANIVDLGTSVTQLKYRTWAGGTSSALPISIQCQKGTNDSKPKTAKVASSIGVPTVPGITTEAVDTFSVSYGTTNATTVCSASPCSYLDQIGNTVSSVTRASAGNYTANLSKSYTKIKCTAWCSGVTSCATQLGTVTGTSIQFIDQNSTNGTSTDSLGTLMCQGVY